MADDAAARIAEALESAVSDLVQFAPGPVVTALSGGVDSAFVAAIAGIPAVSAGVAGTHDCAASKAAAEALGLPITVREITRDEICAALPAVVTVLPDPTVLNVEIAVTEYFICKTAVDAGARLLLTGQGADELFAGYARYGSSEHLREDLNSDLAAYPQQQLRDNTVAALAGIILLQPFMDPRVIEVASTLSGTDLVDGDLRKVALRRAAETRLPHDIAWLPKKAMQYGTGVAKIIEKEARILRISPQEYIDRFRNREIQ